MPVNQIFASPDPQRVFYTHETTAGALTLSEISFKCVLYPSLYDPDSTLYPNLDDPLLHLGGKGQKRNVYGSLGVTLCDFKFMVVQTTKRKY